jgi:hypothetical protein
MTTPTFCTLDGDVATSVGPYTPSVDDMGGAAFEDDDIYPPKPTEQVTAADINQMQQLLVRACRMMPKASFWVRVVSGTATLLGFKSCSDLFTSSDVQVGFVADQLNIIWASGKLPLGAVPPSVTLVSTTPMDVGAPTLIQTTGGANSYVIVSLQDYASAAVSTFTVRVDVDGEGTFRN